MESLSRKKGEEKTRDPSEDKAGDIRTEKEPVITCIRSQNVFFYFYLFSAASAVHKLLFL